MKKLLYTLYISLLLVLTSCISSSVLQTAKPNEKGQVTGVIGLSAYKMEHENVFPGINGMVRFGVGENSDLGLAISPGLLGTIRLDYKYKIWSSSNQNSFLSSGIQADFVLNDSYGGDLDVGATLPLYFSFGHNKNVTPYLAQRYTMYFRDIDVFKYYNKENEQFLSKHHLMTYNGGLGILFGKGRVKWFVESSYALEFNRNLVVWQPSGEDFYQTDRNIDQDFNVELSFGIVLGLGDK